MSAIHAFFPQLLIAFHRVDDTADLRGVHRAHPRVGPGARPADRDLEAQRRRRRAAAALRVRLRHRRVHEDRHRRAVRRQRHATARCGPTVKAKVADLQKKGVLDEAKGKALLDEAPGGADRTVPDGATRTSSRGRRRTASTHPRRPRASAHCPTARPTTASGSPTRPRRPCRPTQIHQIGLDEVARLRKEMDAVRAEVGFSGRPAGLLRGAPRQEGRPALLLPRHRRGPRRLHQGRDGRHRPDQGRPAEVLRPPAEGRPGRQTRRAVPRTAGRRAALLPEHAGRHRGRASTTRTCRT